MIMPNFSSNQEPIVIFDGARGYHAVDWYDTLRRVSNRRGVLLTDMVSREGFKTIVNRDDAVEHWMVVRPLFV